MSNEKPVRLQAQFWQSPFAVTAAIVVTSQFFILSYAALMGRDIPYDTLSALTFVALTMLTAGIWPSWNFLSLDSERLEQHAGLTHVEVEWSQIKSLASNSRGVEVRYIEGPTPEKRVVRAVTLPNRYGVSADRFADLVEHAWRRGGGDTL